MTHLIIDNPIIHAYSFIAASLGICPSPVGSQIILNFMTQLLPLCLALQLLTSINLASKIFFPEMYLSWITLNKIPESEASVDACRGHNLRIIEALIHPLTHAPLKPSSFMFQIL